MKLTPRGEYVTSAFGIMDCGRVVSRLSVSSRSAFSFRWLHAVLPVPMPVILFLSLTDFNFVFNHS